MDTRSVRTMRRGAVLATAAVSVLALITGCSVSADPVTASMTSPARPAASEIAPGEFDDLDLPDLDDLPDLESLPDLEDLPDLEIPGLGDLGDFGFDGFGKCFELLFAYSQLLALAVFSDGSGEEVDEVLGELEQSIPAELSDELRVVAETLAGASEGGLLDAEGALSDPEFLAANEAISTWLTTECVDGDGA